MSKIRVRIAPSPTGSPHVGTAYIALFNYCFAKSQGGDFILRIEDTDQARSKKAYEDIILEALQWTGLRWDEGPDVGGDYGPYRQSERTEIYREHAQILLEKGNAYKCFCTPERLDGLRLTQKKLGQKIGYDGRCMHLPKEEIEALEAKKTPFTIRMKVPLKGTCTFKDPLRGRIEFDYQTIDHQILMKSDHFPTYHLANVVDDHLMKISHVIRGEEWLPSLPKHLLLYEYFGWEAPEVVHLPLLRNEDSSKLSKRKNPTSILYYKDSGILPEALINFLGMMAYTLPNGQEIFTVQDMVSSFEIKRISLGGPIFEQNKLRWVNQKHIAALSNQELTQRLIDWRLNEAFFARLVPLMNERIHKLGDFMQLCDFMFYSEITYQKDALAPKKKELEDTRDFLQKFSWELETLTDFSHQNIEAAFKKIGAIHGWTLRDGTHAVRVAVCGKTIAPPLFHVLAILGSDVTRTRLMQAIKLIGPLGKKKLDKFQKEFQKASSEYSAQPEN